MKTLRTFVLIVAPLFCVTMAKAQWVSIPDTNFGTWLYNNGFNPCLQGDNVVGWEMDTTCTEVVTTDVLGLSGLNLYDITGIEYFDLLMYLDCSDNHLAFIPPLPEWLVSFNCYRQWRGTPLSPIKSLTTLPQIPPTVTDLDCSDNGITILPDLPPNLSTLNCWRNNLTALPNLPGSLLDLDCGLNSITTIPTLPTGLWELRCNDNPLTTPLPALSPVMTELDCENTNISTVPALPATLQIARFGRNPLITSMPTLPQHLRELSCGSTAITSLPALPATLRTFYCQDLSISNLPALPDTLGLLDCSGTSITSIPYLPKTISTLNTGSCLLLTSLPELPDSMYRLNVDATPNLTCLPVFKHVYYLNFISSGFTCWSNYPTVAISSNQPIASKPLCDYFNANSCPVSWNINGKTYTDANNNCTADVGEQPIFNVPVQLWSDTTMLEEVTSTINTNYTFNTTAYGTYQVKVDTANLPFYVDCPAGNVLTSVISAVDSMDYDLNFSLKCKPGFDLQAKSVVGLGFRPATITNVFVQATDASMFHNGNCAAGISGTVTLNFSGPAKYISPKAGALTPTVNGNTLTWVVPDFGSINYFTDFNVVLQTDTSAQLGDTVCFTLNISTTLTGDNNPANNTLYVCFPVTNSYDPNDKQAYPAGNIDTTQRELTYTVRFQNTGNAEAIHIYITDTLSNNIDPASFQLLAYSHPPIVQTEGYAIRFNFPNINLPDSNSNEPASHGFVQYKVRLKDNLPIGTTINNTAYIYFDFNAPVVTNTTTNTISIETGISAVYPNAQVEVYPNPANNMVTITTGKNTPNATITITDVLGRKAIGPVVLSNTHTTHVNTQHLTEGVYMVNVNGSNGARVTKRLVISK